jgi:hypothetical protein
VKCAEKRLAIIVALMLTSRKFCAKTATKYSQLMMKHTEMQCATSSVPSNVPLNGTTLKGRDKIWLMSLKIALSGFQKELSTCIFLKTKLNVSTAFFAEQTGT